MSQLRQFAAALMLALVVSQSPGSLACQETPPPGDVEAVAAQDEPVGQILFAEPILVARFEIDLRKLSELVAAADQVAGHTDWQNVALLFQVFERISIEKILTRSGNEPVRITYDFYITLPVSGSDDYGFAHVAAMPRNAFGGDDVIPVELASLDLDEQGFGTDPSSPETLMLLDGSVIFLCAHDEDQPVDRRSMLLTLQSDFVRRPPQDAFAVTLNPAKIRPSLKRGFANATLATLNAAIQKRDNEDELQFRLREVWGKSAAELIDFAANQVESVRYTLNARAARPGAEVSLSIEAVPNSPFDGWIDRQSRSHGSAVRYLHPDATTSWLLNLRLPDVLKATVPPLADAAADALQKAGMISSSATEEMKSTAANLVRHGSLEFLVQIIPDEQGGMTGMLCLPLRDSPDFSSVAIELVSAIADSDVHVSHRKIDGWPIHLMLEDSDLPLPRADSIQLVVTDNLLVLFVGPNDSGGILENVIRLDFESPSDSDSWRRRGFVFQTELLELLRISGSDADERQKYLGSLDDATVAAEDTVNVTLHHDAHTLEFIATYERCACVFGLTMYSKCIEVLMEGLDF